MLTQGLHWGSRAESLLQLHSLSSVSSLTAASDLHVGKSLVLAVAVKGLMQYLLLHSWDKGEPGCKGNLDSGLADHLPSVPASIPVFSLGSTPRASALVAQLQPGKTVSRWEHVRQTRKGCHTRGCSCNFLPVHPGCPF